MQAQQWLEKCYGDSAPSKTTICRWYAEFERGHTDTEDAEHSGRPNEIVTPETIKKVHQIVFENRKLKLREIADTLKISYGSVYAILHEHLSMRKLLSKWVSRCSRWIKNDNVALIPSAVWSCFAEINRIFASVCDNGRNLDPSLHSGVKAVVSRVDCSRREASKAAKNANVGR